MLRPRGVVIDQELSSRAAPLPATDVSALASEAQIIAKCRAGNTAAWDSLFDKYYATVARFVFQLSGDFSHEDTEEICQETFLSVVRNLSSFQGRSSFQTWFLIPGSNPISNLLIGAGGKKGDVLSEKNGSRETRWKRCAHFNRCRP